MKTKFKTNQVYIYIFFFILSSIIAIKAEQIGPDAPRYANIFFKFNEVKISWFLEKIYNYDLFEIGFLFFTKFISSIYLNSYFFFFIVSLFIISLLYFSYKSLNVGINIYHDLIFVSLLLFSSWFITEVANGIKQGLSLSILYFAISTQLKRSNYIKFTILFFISTSFHISVFLTLPFLLLIKFRLKYIYILWFFLLLFYIIGLNETIVKIISDYFSTGVYKTIKYYGAKEGVGKWIGFQLEFVLYTFFFGILPILLTFLNLIKLKNQTNLIFVIKIYLILSMVYFVFGFGPWSNRVAVICWFFIPLLQVALFANLKLNFKSLQYVSIILIIVSINYFIFYRLQLLL